MGMMQSLDRVKLALKPGKGIDGSDQLEVQHLDRNDLIVVRVRTPYLSKATLADQAVELVPGNLERVCAVQLSTLTIAVRDASSFCASRDNPARSVPSSP
jgi:hypothetical protein